MNECGFFGGIKYDIIEEYKEYKPALFEEYMKVRDGILSSEDCLVPLMMWYSNHIDNIKAIQDLNKKFFYVNKSILNRGLLLRTKRYIKFITYPKNKKEENELDFLIPYVIKYYGWSEREYNLYKGLINLEDTDLHLELNRCFALDNKELKKLGIKQEKIQAKYEKESKVKGFFK